MREETGSRRESSLANPLLTRDQTSVYSRLLEKKKKKHINFPSPFRLSEVLSASAAVSESLAAGAASLFKLRPDGSGIVAPVPLRGREWPSLAAAFSRRAISRSGPSCQTLGDSQRLCVSSALLHSGSSAPGWLYFHSFFSVVSTPCPSPPALWVTLLSATALRRTGEEPRSRGVVYLILFSIILSPLTRTSGCLVP